MNPQVKELCEGETVKCPTCGAKMMAFMYSTAVYGDYEYGLGCPKCGRKDY